MSSGLDSTSAFLKLLNNQEINKDIIFPTFIWWRDIFIKVLEKEYFNCKEILKYIKKKYSDKYYKIYKLKKIEIPLSFYEKIRSIYRELDNFDDYFCYFRNSFFILSSLSYFLNYLKLKRTIKIENIFFVTGFIGYEADENYTFSENIKRLINDYINDPNHSGIVEKVNFYNPYVRKDIRSRSIQYHDICEFNDWEVLKYTWSCWRNSEKPCLKCPGCIGRKEKFESFKDKFPEKKDPFLEVN
jgi:7-cyano-7-deazaguanine synthase in queuosine biosynthesis